MVRKAKAGKLAKEAGIARDTTAIDALHRLLREGASAYDARRDLILTDDDPEHVHQARVGLRRMRSLMRGFSGMLTPKIAKHLAALLARKFHQLGPLRDADVHAMALEGLPGAEAALQDAADLRQQLRTELQDERGLSLKAEIGTELYQTSTATRGARRTRMAQAPVGIMASRALQMTWTELLAFGPDLDALSPDERHDFRKRAKDMRYLTDFFRGLYDGDQKPMLKRMARMQDALGLMNDLETMRAAQDQPDALPLPENAEDIEAKAHKSAQKAWTKLRGMAPWWSEVPL